MNPNQNFGIAKEVGLIMPPGSHEALIVEPQRSNKPLVVKALRALIRMKVSNCVFLMDTKIDSSCMNYSLGKVGFFNIVVGLVVCFLGGL